MLGLDVKRRATGDRLGETRPSIHSPNCTDLPRALEAAVVLLANFGKDRKPEPILPKISQEVLVEGSEPRGLASAFS